ncbi:MAG TPA: hypothetical protein DIC52_09925 [Candidatus Latescibacteria bacterium]|nr:hypothetical protein [Candidatus Latescibacterota bacterium]
MSLSVHRRRISMVLLAASEATIVGMVIAVTLLYSPSLADNYLGKTALFHLFGGAAVLLWGLARGIWGPISWPRSPILLPFLGFILIAGVAAIGARNVMLAWEEWLAWAQWLLLFVVVADLSRDHGRMRRLVLVLLSLCAVVSAIGLLQVLGYDLMSLPAVYQGTPLSSLGNTNFVAHYLEVVLPLAFAITLYGGWSRPVWSLPVRLAAASVLGCGAILLVLAGSRGGWLGVGVALLVMFWAAPRPADWGRRLLLAILTAGLLSPVAGFVLESVPVAGGGTAADVVEELVDSSWTKVMSTFDGANFSRAMRLLIWRDGLQLVQAHTWLGVGPGHYGLELPAYRSTTAQRQWRELMGRRGNQPYHAHNEFLEVWAETGIAGVVMLIALLAVALRVAWRLSRRPTEDNTCATDRSLALGGLGGLVAVTVHAFFSFNLRDPVSGTHVWVLCALVAGAMDRDALHGRLIQLAGTWRRIIFLALLAGITITGAYQGLCMLMGDVYYLRSRQHLAEGHGNRAILALRQATDWREHEFSYHHGLGQVALGMKQYGEAVQALSRSLELHDNNPGAVRLLARALLARQEGARAVLPLRHAIDIDTLTPENYVLLADALRQSSQPVAAIAVRRQAVSLRGEPGLLLDLALDHLAAGHADTALAVLAQTAHTAPRDAAIIGNLGALQIKAGQPVEGEANLRRALDLEPDRAAWHGNLGQALVAQRRYREALVEAGVARKLQPDDPRWEQLILQLERLNTTTRPDEGAAASGGKGP